MNRAMQITLLLLAVVVASFAAAWATLPSSSSERVGRPASFFAFGGVAGTRYEQVCVRFGPRVPNQPRPCVETAQRGSGNEVDVERLRRRVYAIHGGAAAVIFLVGLAFGAARHKRGRES